MVTSTVLNAKINEVANKIPDTNGLVTTTVLSRKIRVAENKILDVSSLVKKTNYNIETSDIEKKCFTFSDLDKKIATLKPKAELKAKQDKILKLQTFNSSCFCGKSDFEDDDM